MGLNRLWFPDQDTTYSTFQAAVLDAAADFFYTFGRWPQKCYVHSTTSDPPSHVAVADGSQQVQVFPDDAVLPGHFLLSADPDG